MALLQTEVLRKDFENVPEWARQGLPFVGVGVVVWALYGAFFSGSLFLSPSVYEGALYSHHVLAALIGKPWLALAAALPLFDRSSKCLTPPSIRLPVILLLSGLVWFAVLHPFNVYFNQAHSWDRLLLFVLFLTSVRYFSLLPLVLVFSLASIQQFDVPFRSIGDDYFIFWVYLIPTWAWLLVRFGQRKEPRELFSVLLCAWAMVYGWAALSKLAMADMAWFRFATLGNFWVNASLYGLSPWSVSTVREWAPLLDRVDWPIKVGILALELSPLYALWAGRHVRTVLLALIGMHVGIAATTGIFYWQWIWSGVALMMCHQRQSTSPAVFSLRGGILIVLLYLGLKPVGYGWVDVPQSVTYQIRAVTAEGAERTLPADFFYPYSPEYWREAFEDLAGWKSVPTYYGSLFDTGHLSGLSTLEEFRPELSPLPPSSRTSGQAVALGQFLNQFLCNVERARGIRFPDRVSPWNAMGLGQAPTPMRVPLSAYRLCAVSHRRDGLGQGNTATCGELNPLMCPTNPL